MGTAGSAPAASWPATEAARRAQWTRALAVATAGGTLVAIALMVIGAVAITGGLDEPAGGVVAAAFLAGFWGAALVWFGGRLIRRWRRVQAVVEAAPWVATTGSALSTHASRRVEGQSRRALYLAAVVLPDGGTHVLAVVDRDRPRLSLFDEAARPLWVARHGSAWAISPAGGGTPMHARPLDQAERSAIGRDALGQLEGEARAATGAGPFGSPP